MNWVENRIRQDPSLVLFAMIDKTRLSDTAPRPRSPSSSEATTLAEAEAQAVSEAPAIAGIIGLLNTVPSQYSTEIGLLFTLPSSQRTHATTHAVGLLLRWCFNDLGMHRVQWRSDPQNIASVRVAERMGFKKETLRRWDRALPPGKAGAPVRPNDVHPDSDGLHTLYFSICRDDWEEWEGRVEKIMERR